VSRAPLGGLLAVALGLWAMTAEAGPWPAGKGRVYAKLAYGHLTSTHLAFPDGTLFDIPEFRKDDGDLYVFYGVSERLSLLADLPLRSSDLDDDPDELQRETGIGDLEVGFQLQLGLRGSWAIAARGGVQAPTGNVERGDGLQPTGSGEWESELVLSSGRSFARGRLYGFAEAGYQLRGGELRDGMVFGAQLGWNATSRLTLAANVYGVEPWSHAAREEASGSPVGLGDRVAYVKYGPTASLKLDERWGVQLDVEGVAHAHNLATGVTYRVGLFFKD
jgi:hypothetical protein